jgi:hypothetical protein
VRARFASAGRARRSRYRGGPDRRIPPVRQPGHLGGGTPYFTPLAKPRPAADRVPYLQLPRRLPSLPAHALSLAPMEYGFGDHPIQNPARRCEEAVRECRSTGIDNCSSTVGAKRLTPFTPCS